jgi:hypothetical protein
LPFCPYLYPSAMSRKRTEWAEGGPTQQSNPDRELARSFGVGCGVLVLVFLCGWATIAFFWLR